MSYYITKNDSAYELYHHGVKGQKWGLRRYQNPDGSLTPEGREHYGYGEQSIAYKQGLREATLRGGLTGRSKYKKEHAKEAAAYEEEKRFLKSAKKIRKKEAYRDRLVKENTSQVSRNENLAKRYRDEAKDLKKYGADSETYKKYVKDKINKTNQDLSKSLDKQYGDGFSDNSDMVAIFKGLNSASYSSYYKKHANTEIKSLLDSKNKNAQAAIKRAKQYVQSNEQLMNMSINELTRKKDIRRTAQVN